MSIKTFLSTGSVLLATTFSISAAVDTPYEVGLWANFCQGAVTHGFDDNMNSNPNAEEQKIFDDKGFHITLHVQTGSCNWENCKASFAKGHEISSHSVSHSSSETEIKPSQEAIKKNVPGEMCVTMAYPNCNTPGDAKVLQTYIAGRNCDGQTASSSPSNMAQISSKMFGSGQCGCPNDANGLNSFADQAVSKKGWSVYCHHGIGSQSHNWAVTSLSAMKSHIEYLDQNRDKIWMETFGNVARYIKERNAASVTQKDSTDAKFTVSVTDDLADSIFNYPLSIRRPLPEGWNKVVVKQDTTEVEDTIVEVSSKKYIMFKAVPDGGDVTISNGDIVSVSADHRTKGATVPVARQNAMLTINRSYFSGKTVSVTFFDVSGKVIERKTIGTTETGVSLRDSHLSNTTFIAKISDGQKSYTDIYMPQL